MSRFRAVRLVPDQQIVRVIEFETHDAATAGEMTITHTLTEADGGTHLTGIHEDLPPAVSPADNEVGWRKSLNKLARLAETAKRRLPEAPHLTSDHTSLEWRCASNSSKKRSMLWMWEA
jgi:hypothetical protein